MIIADIQMPEFVCELAVSDLLLLKAFTALYIFSPVSIFFLHCVMELKRLRK